MVRTNTHNQVQSFVHRALRTVIQGLALIVLGSGALTPDTAQAQNAAVRPSDGRPAPPKPLEFDAKPIVFRNGVPVKGQAHLTLYPDGRYHFTGHFHDPGMLSYNVELAWIVRPLPGSAFLFLRNGHVQGTAEPGPRNYDWDVSGVSAELQHDWKYMTAAIRVEWRADVNADINRLIYSLKDSVMPADNITRVVQVVTP